MWWVSLNQDSLMIRCSWNENIAYRASPFHLLKYVSSWIDREGAVLWWLRIHLEGEHLYMENGWFENDFNGLKYDFNDVPIIIKWSLTVDWICQICCASSLYTRRSPCFCTTFPDQSLTIETSYGSNDFPCSDSNNFYTISPFWRVEILAETNNRINKQKSVPRNGFHRMINIMFIDWSSI